jgi:predicted RNA methylase
LTLASFVQRNFPQTRFPRVADVAGGTGMLALELIRLGYSAVVVDPRRSGLPMTGKNVVLWTRGTEAYQKT